MKEYSKEELAVMAQGYYESENVDTIHATSDGQFFVKESFQKRHADDKGLQVYTFKKDEAETEIQVVETKTESDSTTLSVKQLYELLLTITVIADLKKMHEAEAAAQNRPSALEAIDKRIAHLNLEADLATIDDEAKLSEMKTDFLKKNRKSAAALIDQRLAQLSNK